MSVIERVERGGLSERRDWVWYGKTGDDGDGVMKQDERKPPMVVTALPSGCWRVHYVTGSSQVRSRK